MDSPALQRIRVARPCSARWADMEGDDQVRHCELCRKNVYNFAALTEREAVRLLELETGGLCGLLYRRPDGTLLTADCPRGKGARAARVVRRAAAAVATLVLTLGGRFLTPDGQESSSDPTHHPVPASSTRPPAGAFPVLDPEVIERLGALGYIT